MSTPRRGDIVLYYPVGIGLSSEEQWIKKRKFYGVVLEVGENSTRVCFYTEEKRFYKASTSFQSIIVLGNVSDFGEEMPDDR